MLSFHQNPGLKGLTLPECTDFQGWMFLLGNESDNWVPWVSTKTAHVSMDLSMHVECIYARILRYFECIQSVQSLFARLTTFNCFPCYLTCHHLASDQMMMTVEGSEPAQHVAEPSCN